jgi:hypothetical protein
MDVIKVERIKNSILTFENVHANLNFKFNLIIFCATSLILSQKMQLGFFLIFVSQYHEFIYFIKFIIILRWKFWGLKINLRFLNFLLINFLRWKFKFKFKLYVNTSSKFYLAIFHHVRRKVGFFIILSMQYT